MAHTVKAEMAGMIEDVTAEPGTAIGAEDEVVLMSSMKMEIPIVAGRDGRVGEILVDIGDAVKAGDALFTIET